MTCGLWWFICPLLNMLIHICFVTFVTKLIFSLQLPAITFHGFDVVAVALLFLLSNKVKVFFVFFLLLVLLLFISCVIKFACVIKMSFKDVQNIRIHKYN